MLPRKNLPALLVAIGALALAAPAAGAAPVLVLPHEGPAHVVQDRFSVGPTPLDAPRTRAGREPAGARRAPAARAARRAHRGPSVRGELRRMLKRGEIDRPQYDARLSSYNDTRRLAARLSGRRGTELAGVVELVDTVTARRELTVSRLAPLWLTLERNREWWSNGSLLSAGQRIQFEGSELLWQYVPGYGVQLHPLANFGRLNGLWQGGPRYATRMGHLMDELLALRVERAGGVAWEYYFPFGPAQPPWVSGMAQATALQSLARAAIRLHREPEVFPIAAAGLGIFEQAPPTGVRVPAEAGGVHYLLYSGDPGLRVLNGFMQALSGLYDFGRYTGDQRAFALYDAGRTAAAPEIEAADTGAWSLYSLGRVSQESNLSYHKLLTSFLATLCANTGDSLYCDSQTRFGSYLSEPAELKVSTRRLRAGRPGRVRFRLSKKAAVSVQVTQGTRTALSRSLGTLPYGRRYLAFNPSRRRPGTYTVTLAAVDQAGNRSTASAAVEVLPARRPRRGGS